MSGAGQWLTNPKTGGYRPRPLRRVGSMEIRIQCLCIDTIDPAELATFWESALGWRRTFEQDDHVVLEPPAGSPEDGIAPDLLFLRVPDSRASSFPQQATCTARARTSVEAIMATLNS